MPRSKGLTRLATRWQAECTVNPLKIKLTVTAQPTLHDMIHMLQYHRSLLYFAEIQDYLQSTSKPKH